MFSLAAAQTFMTAEGIDAWLLYDYRGGNPLFWTLIGDSKAPTRRAFLIVPGRGEPVLLIHTIDQMFFIDVALPKRVYRSWEEMRALVAALLGAARRVAVD